MEDEDDEDNYAMHRRGGKDMENRKKKKQKTNQTSIIENEVDSSSIIDETKRDKKKNKKTKGLSVDAVESLVAFAQASGKERPSLEDLVVLIRLEDLHHDDEWHGSSSPPAIEKPSHDQTLLATMDDGQHSLPIFILNDPENEQFQDYLAKSLSKGDGGVEASAVAADWVCLAVKGLVTTDGHNPKFDLEPIVCLTQYEIISPKHIQLPSGFGVPYRLPGPRIPADIHPRSPTKSSQQQQQHGNKSATSSHSSLTTARVRAGTIGTFLERSLPFMTMEEFVRCHDTNVQRLLLSERPLSVPEEKSNAAAQQAVLASIATVNQQADQVQTFLTRHVALLALQTSSSSSSQPTPEHTVQNYSNSVREFASSQLDRQKASLVSNAGREAADRATLITRQYNSTLEQALKHESTSIQRPKDILSSARLLEWHSILLKDLHTEAGQIRTKTVRAGNTVFTRPKDIMSEMDKFCRSMTKLQELLQINGGGSGAAKSPHSSIGTNAWQVVLFAAVAMYGIVDIHPFADGNGRMSRIVANWALKSFPFTINLFATPAQRAEYILALETTRHLLSLTNEKKTHGSVSSHDILQITKSIGIFGPLVRLLMDRVGRAVVEFNRVWQDKLGLAAEALECKAARQARERAKEGTCLICLEEGPNIATLCCGNAVHLNCIAEWLSGKNSCPNCRSEMPSISGRIVRAARNAESERFLNDDEARMGAVLSPSRTRRMRRRYFQNAQDVIVSLLSNYSPYENTTTETAEDGYDSAQDTTANAGAEDDDERGAQNRMAMEEDDEASDSSSSDGDEEDYSIEYDSSDASAAGSAEPERQRGIQADDSASSTEDHPDANAAIASTLRVHSFCDALYCRNRPAIDCTNNLCGRCCILGGEFHCPRHNS